VPSSSNPEKHAAARHGSSPWPLASLKSWFRHADFKIHVAVLAIVALVLGFLELSDEILETSEASIDRRLRLMLRGAGRPDDPIGSRWVEAAWREITALGSDVIVGLITVFVMGFLLMNKMLRSALLLLVAVVGGGLLSVGLKLTFARPRPDFVQHMVEVSSASFPSGHSLISAVVYPTLGALLASLSPTRTAKVYYLTTAFLLMVLVGVSRMYLGVHYPTDVLAGWALGLAWALACWVGSEMLQRRGKLHGEQLDPASQVGVLDKDAQPHPH
jgi:undecaprenyl-diphosphatase